MLERLLLAVILLGVGYVVYCVYTRDQLDRVRQGASADPILQDFRRGVPAIVYFTTPTCVPCKTRQQPALSRLRDILGEDNIQIIKVDATQDPMAANRWGVLSAPTTFILNSDGKPVVVNHGLADEDKLKRQIEAFAS